MPGQYRDVETGLAQNWWRTYDPVIGRYTQEEPQITTPFGATEYGWSEGNLPYTYASGAPQKYFDPSGEGIVDCATELVELARLQAKLAGRIAENCACPDRGHTKAIEQLQNLVGKQAAKVAKHCADAETLFQALVIAAAGALSAGAGGAAAAACAL